MKKLFSTLAAAALTLHLPIASNANPHTGPDAVSGEFVILPPTYLQFSGWSAYFNERSKIGEHLLDRGTRIHIAKNTASCIGEELKVELGAVLDKLLDDQTSEIPRPLLPDQLLAFSEDSIDGLVTETFIECLSSNAQTIIVSADETVLRETYETYPDLFNFYVNGFIEPFHFEKHLEHSMEAVDQKMRPKIAQLKSLLPEYSPD